MEGKEEEEAGRRTRNGEDQQVNKTGRKGREGRRGGRREEEGGRKRRSLCGAVDER